MMNDLTLTGATLLVPSASNSGKGGDDDHHRAIGAAAAAVTTNYGTLPTNLGQATTTLHDGDGGSSSCGAGGATLTMSKQQQQQQQQQPKQYLQQMVPSRRSGGGNKNNNSKKPCCEKHQQAVSQQQQPGGSTAMTSKVPVIQLIREQTTNQLYKTLHGLVRMGTFEMFYEIVTTWREYVKEQQQQQHHDPLVVSLSSSSSSSEAEEKKETATTPPSIKNVKTSSSSTSKANVDEVLRRNDMNGYSLLHIASKRHDDVRFVRYLRLYISPFRRSVDDTLMTSLHWACTIQKQKQYSLPVIRTLLTRPKPKITTTTTITNNSNLNSKLSDKDDDDDYARSLLCVTDATGCTPLLIAAQHGCVEIVAYLIQKGASINDVDYNGDSATHWAAYKGSETVLGLLSYYDNKQLLQPDIYGQMPLHLAALRGHASVCKYILQDRLVSSSIGVRDVLYHRDKNDRTPLDLAIYKKKLAVAATLRDIMEQQFDDYDDGSNSSGGGSDKTMKRIRRFIKHHVLSMFSLHSWKVWFGVHHAGDIYDESPKFPYYYVWFLFIWHLCYMFIIFFPLHDVSNGVLWDNYHDSITAAACCMVVLWCFSLFTFYKTTYTNPGRMDTDDDHDPNDTDRLNIRYWRQLYEQTLESYANNDDDVDNDDDSNTHSKDGTAENCCDEDIINKKTMEKKKYDDDDRPQLCHTCHIAKPPRSKHDRFTRVCILQFDHHCPFVGTTIGLYNYRYFIMFLFFISAYLVLFCFLLAIYYVRSTTNLEDHDNINGEVTTISSASTSTSTTPWFAMLSGIFLGIHILFPAGMLIYHTQLMVANLTTNEHMNLSKYSHFWINSSNENENTNNDDDGNRMSSSSQEHYNNNNTARRSKRTAFRNPWDKGWFRNIMDRIIPTEDSYMLPQHKNKEHKTKQQQQLQLQLHQSCCHNDKDDNVLYNNDDEEKIGLLYPHRGVDNNNNNSGGEGDISGWDCSITNYGSSNRDNNPVIGTTTTTATTLSRNRHNVGSHHGGSRGLSSNSDSSTNNDSNFHHHHHHHALDVVV